MKIATEGLKIERLNKGEIVDFSEVKTVEQLKGKISEDMRSRHG